MPIDYHAARQLLLPRLLTVGGAIVFTAFLVVAVDSTIVAPGKDLSAFIYLSKGIPEGDIPYLDRWDNKGPVMYLLVLVGLVIGGTFGIWALGATFLLASTWLSFKIARDAFGTAAALVSCAFFLAYFEKLGDGGNLTEHYALLFQFLALFLFFRIEGGSDKHGVLLCLTIGVLGAAAFLLRANLVGVWLAIGLYWMVRKDRALKWVLYSIVGGLAVFLLVALIFTAAGALGPLWDAVIVYNLKYSTASFIDRLEAVKTLGYHLFVVAVPLAAGWCIGCWYWLSGKARGKSYESILTLALILGPIEVALLTVSGHRFTHYYLTILPAVTLTLAFLVKFFLDRRIVAPALLTTAILFSMACYYLPYHVRDAVNKYAHADEYPLRGRFDNVAQRVREATQPGDIILSWGNQSEVYLLSERDAPSRFYTQFPLINRSYADEKIRGEFISDVMSNKPVIIVEIEDQRLPPLDREERLQWRPKGRRYLDQEHYESFFHLVDTEYEFVEEVDGVKIFMKRP